jgi:hypothetical protein
MEIPQVILQHPWYLNGTAILVLLLIAFVFALWATVIAKILVEYWYDFYFWFEDLIKPADTWNPPLKRHAGTTKHYNTGADCQYDPPKMHIEPPNATFFGRFNGETVAIEGPDEVKYLAPWEVKVYKRGLERRVSELKAEKESAEAILASKKAQMFKNGLSAEQNGKNR